MLMPKLLKIQKYPEDGEILWAVASICNVFDINKKSEHTSYREVVRIFHVWWRRGESNPCPKTHPQVLLRAQAIFNVPLPQRQSPDFTIQ